MNLSHSDVRQRAGCGLRRGRDQAAEDGLEIEAAIEAVRHFGQVTGCVLGEGKGVVGAADCSLQVAKHGVNGLEFGMQNRLPSDPGADRMVVRHFERQTGLDARVGVAVDDGIRHRVGDGPSLGSRAW